MKTMSLQERAKEETGNPTGVAPGMARFPEGDTLECKYHDGYLAGSEWELRNHYAMYHAEAGPRGDSRGEHIARDGTRFYTLSERLAYERNYIRRDVHGVASGESFVNERAARAARFARRHKQNRQSFAPLSGDR